ncbi:MAG: DnaA/Hda family protein, partial [Pseudomonadota bacterium]
MTNEAWGDIRKNLIGQVGRNNYVNWIEPLQFSDLENGVATFHVPTQFVGTWVSRNFGDTILRELNGSGHAVSRIEFNVPDTHTDTSKPDAPKPSFEHGLEDDGGVAHGASDDLPGAPLDARFTFDSFVVGKPNELAHAAARRVAEGGAISFNPLFLYGGVGLGKTHLMHAIAWELKKRKPDLRVVYLSAEQFMYRFVQALRDKEMIGFKQLFRSVDVLMVDDVQFIAGKDATQEEFFHTFNALVDQNKQIILSADRAPTEIAGIEDRIVSRMQSGLV